jgi:hypothetical protein
MTLVAREFGMIAAPTCDHYFMKIVKNLLD